MNPRETIARALYQRCVMSDRCRHHKSLVVGLMRWCYECGAIRKLRYVTGHAGPHIEAASGWIKPVGKGGENPWEKWRD